MTVDGRSSSASSADGPGSATSLRLANQRRVLAALLARGSAPLTQADLGRETGLAAGTVSSIVRELAAADILTTVPGSGRRGTTVRVGRGAGLAAGIDFGHSHLSVVVGDMSGVLLGEKHERIDPSLTHEVGLRPGHRPARPAPRATSGPTGPAYARSGWGCPRRSPTTS